MVKILNLLVFFVLIANILNAQPKLRLRPDRIEFRDIFNRLQNVYFVNEGDQPVTVDSLQYNQNYYFVRFNSPQYLPLTIAPGDSILMDCILDGYYYVPSADTTDTLVVYNNGENPIEYLQIRIRYYDDDFGESTIGGVVTDTNLVPIPDARVYFFYGGTYIINSTLTDQNGNYSANLPPGNYKICARKDSFYVTFYGQKFDPFSADFISVMKDSQYTADIALANMMNTNLSVNGTLYDSTSGAPLAKGIIVVRKGNHTPTKMIGKIAGSPDSLGIYTVFVNQDGAYSVSNIVQQDYYFIQSFSDYFVPSYFKTPDSSSTFWQNADSVFVNTHRMNINVHMPRDSSIGGGTIHGTIGTTLFSSGNTLGDVVLYAQSTDYSAPPFNYSFVENNNTYSIPYLPVGNYRIIAQKIGYDDAYSTIVTISRTDTIISGVNLTFNISSAGEKPVVPNDIVLYQNYPNPFNPTTIIKYSLPQSSDITLRVINILGQEVAVLKKGFQQAGTHEVQLNGDEMSSGIYFVQLKAGNISKVKKIVLLK